VAQPSFVEEGGLASSTRTLFIAAAEKEIVLPAEKRHKPEEILQKTSNPYPINLYSGTSHGVAVSCDLSKKVEKFC